jgi:hypothetical protein
MMMQEPARSAKSSRIKTEHNAHHVHQPLNRERSTRGDALTTVQMEQAIPQGLAPYPVAPNTTPIRLVQQSFQASQTFGSKELLPEGPLSVAPGHPRKVIDLTGSSTSGYDKFSSSSIPSGESRDYSRYSQAQNITPPAHPRPRDPPQATTAEPPRRVNIMSMLNPEPSEEKPQKQPEPQPQPRSHHAPEQVGFQRDPYGRESHHRPTSSIHDRDVGVPSSSQREPGWPTRSYGPPSHHSYSDSPRLAPQPDYRTAALGQLNTHTRSVHSPPPGGAYHHSRTSSYSTANQAQHGSNPSSAAGTPTEPYPRSSLSRNPAFGSGPPLAAAQNTQPHHPSSYAPLPPDRRDMVDPNSSATFGHVGLRAFRNHSSQDYDSQAPPGQPGAAGAPPPPAPPSSHHRPPYGSSGGGPPPPSQSHHPSHSSPQPPADPRYTAPPPAVSRGPPQPMSYDQRGVPAPLAPHATDQRYAEEMRRREDEMRRSGGPGGPPPPHPGQQQAPRRY